MNDVTIIILAGAALTYLTRFAGHLALSRFRTLPPRVDAALNAVPAAVLTTLVAPAAAEGGPLEIATLAIMALLSLRMSALTAFIISAIVVAVGRQAGF